MRKGCNFLFSLKEQADIMSCSISLVSLILYLLVSAYGEIQNIHILFL